MKPTRKEIFTIPNLLGYFRILLVPVCAWLYIRQQYWLAALCATLSGISDLLDGWLARRLNQVTDLGKLLDPVADKLTQGLLVFCLSSRYPLFLFLLIPLWVLKEGYMAAAMIYMHKKYRKRLDGAKWYGKVSTWIMDVSMVVLLIPGLPRPLTDVLTVFIAAALIFSGVCYAGEYLRMAREP